MLQTKTESKKGKENMKGKGDDEKDLTMKPGVADCVSATETNPSTESDIDSSSQSRKKLSKETKENSSEWEFAQPPTVFLDNISEKNPSPSNKSAITSGSSVKYKPVLVNQRVTCHWSFSPASAGPKVGRWKSKVIPWSPPKQIQCSIELSSSSDLSSGGELEGDKEEDDDNDEDDDEDEENKEDEEVEDEKETETVLAETFATNIMQRNNTQQYTCQPVVDAPNNWGDFMETPPKHSSVDLSEEDRNHKKVAPIERIRSNNPIVKKSSVKKSSDHNPSQPVVDPPNNWGDFMETPPKHASFYLSKKTEITRNLH
jgi:hypothetical protein